MLESDHNATCKLLSNNNLEYGSTVLENLEDKLWLSTGKGSKYSHAQKHTQ